MLEPHYIDDLVTLYHGDCIEVLREMPDNSVHAVVTDPPYGLEFMGKEWDSFASPDMVKRSGWDTTNNGAKITDDEGKPFGRVGFHKRRSTARCPSCGKRDAFRSPHGTCPDVWEHAWVDDLPLESLSFGQWCELWAVECLRVLKPGGHLLAFGGTRTWHRLACAVEDVGFEVRDNIAWMYGSGFPKSMDVSKAIDKAAGAEREVVGTRKQRANLPESNVPMNVSKGEVELITAPATDAAREWQGWGTALKPAFEPVVVARKPLIGTVAANVLAHGTGALNIDGCRIGTQEMVKTQGTGKGVVVGKSDSMAGPQYEREECGVAVGRWPANVILDESQAEELDKQSGFTASAVGGSQRSGSHSDLVRQAPRDGLRNEHGDIGGASRFFYTSKASTFERPRADDIAHPTVKPLDLMRYLVRLVTPPGGIVLEPFAGSGTTAEACVIEGFNCIAIEREPDYLPLIVQRLTKPIEQTLGF